MLGENTLHDLFTFDPEITHFNWGGLGVPPKPIVEAKRRYSDRMETCADRFYRLELPLLTQKSVNLLAETLHVQPDSIAFMDNLTFAADTLFESWDLGSDDAVLVTSFIYGVLEWKLAEMSKKRGFHLVHLHIPIPLESDEALLKLFETILEQHKNVKYAVIDHITSMGSILMPVKPLTQLLQSRGVRVFVDGAHATGQVLNLDLSDINAEYYAGNLHKWFFAPRSLSVVHVRDAADRDRVTPLIMSWTHHESILWRRFSFLGTRDYTNVCVIPDILQLREKLGGHERIDAYIRDLKAQGMAYLAQCPELYLQPIPVPQHAPYQVTFILPEVFQKNSDKISKMNDTPLNCALWHVLLSKYRICVAVFKMKISGNMTWCVRISVHIHNTMQHFHHLADGLKRFAHDLETEA